MLRLGHEVTIMTHADCELAEMFRQAGAKVIDFHPTSKWSRADTKFIRETLLQGTYDFLHLFNSAAITTGVRAAKMLPVKVIIYRGFTGNVHWWAPYAYLKVLHPRVDRIHCLARSVKESIDAQAVFVRPKTVIIHKGHDPAWYDAITPLTREELNVPEDAFLVVCVANRRKMKGMPYLAKALTLLPPELPVYTLFVGRDLDTPKVKRILENHPNPSRIQFTGHRQDAWRIVKAADTFVLPSIYGEATTKAVIEAMALGVAPVITDIEGNRELVRHEQEGLVVKRANPQALADGIQTLYADPGLCARYAAAARKHIETEFSSGETLQNLLALYRELQPA